RRSRPVLRGWRGPGNLRRIPCYPRSPRGGVAPCGGDPRRARTQFARGFSSTRPAAPVSLLGRCFVSRARTSLYFPWDGASPPRKTARRTLMREPPADRSGRLDRRGFLGTGAGALAAAATLGEGPPAAAQTATAAVPRRPLGRTGVQVTILNL